MGSSLPDAPEVRRLADMCQTVDTANRLDELWDDPAELYRRLAACGMVTFVGKHKTPRLRTLGWQALTALMVTALSEERDALVRS